MIGNILNVALVVLVIALAVIWIIALANSDGSHCDPDQCDNCPYSGSGCKPTEPTIK